MLLFVLFPFSDPKLSLSWQHSFFGTFQSVTGLLDYYYDNNNYNYIAQDTSIQWNVFKFGSSLGGKLVEFG